MKIFLSRNQKQEIGTQSLSEAPSYCVPADGAESETEQRDGEWEWDGTQGETHTPALFVEGASFWETNTLRTMQMWGCGLGVSP